MNNPFADSTVICTYTRAQALEDGGLIDVSETAREAGFKVPVALTAAAWGDCVAWDEKDAKTCQDEAGRLWDVLNMAAMAALCNRQASRVPFSVLRVPRWGARPEPAHLVLHIGPGDEGEPVITIMQPGED